MTEETSDLLGRKIVILIAGFARGGSERQAYLLARELRQRRELDVEVWALFLADWYPGDYAKDFEAVGVPTRVLGFGMPRYGWVQRCLPIVRALRNHRADILLPLTLWPNVVAGLCYRLAGVRSCVWGERSSGSEIMPRPARIAARQYRRFVANSTAGINFLKDEMNVARHRIAFVPNAVEMPVARSGTDWRKNLRCGQDQPLVVKIANITGYKDHFTLLRAWKSVQDGWTETQRPVLALAGYHADTFEACRQFVVQTGLDSTVRFLGGISDTADLLHACDLTVFSSRKEGMPNAVLECMAAGKAVVSTDLPGVRDAMGPCSADALVPPGDPEALANSILAYLKDRQRREVLGRKNLQRIRDEFSVKRMTDGYLRAVRDAAPHLVKRASRGKAPVKFSSGATAD